MKNTILSLRTTGEVRERIEYHAKRVGADMNSIIREATLAYLDKLDEKEALREELKQSRKQKGAFVPPIVPHQWGRPPGLGLRRMQPISITTPPPPIVATKFKNSFRRWAEFLEQAKDEADSTRRADEIMQDIRDRVKAESEVKSVFAEFQSFLVGRTDAKTITSNTSRL